MIELDAAEQRVLGALLEKEVTVPATYPLSLNGLRTACNQTTSRDPVTAYTEDDLNAITLALQERRLIRLVRDHGGRTVKFAQRLSETLGIEGAARALLTVLLLRGPQAPGELKTRTERLHPFADRGEVEAELARMAALDDPLVRELERLPGQQDTRWVHLLGEVPAPEVPPAPVDVLAEGEAVRDERVRTAYDSVADAYSENFGSELDHKPFDRWWLARLAELAEGQPMADAGCGTGHLTAYLKSLGARCLGFDLSPGMIQRAKTDHPGVRFEVADLRNLPKPGDGWAVVVAHYALVHLAASEVPAAIAALARTLRPGGWLSLATHVGREVRHVEDWFGHSVDLHFVFHEAPAVRAAVTTAGLELAEWYVRGPLSGVEAETERLYVLARKPGGER